MYSGEEWKYIPQGLKFVFVPSSLWNHEPLLRGVIYIDKPLYIDSFKNIKINIDKGLLQHIDIKNGVQ